MLTPQEVQDKKFSKSFMSGYEMSAVDDFLEILTADYSSLYKENAILKSKIRVLVEKLEEYRSVDDSMRKTWREAQKKAEELLNEARDEADNIRAYTENFAQKRQAELSEQFKAEEHRLSVAQEETVKFVNSLREIYQRQIDQLSIIPAIQPPPQSPAESVLESTGQIASEISKAVGEQIEQELGEVPQNPFVPPSEPQAPAEKEFPIIDAQEGGFAGPEGNSPNIGYYGPDGSELDKDLVKILWEPEKDTVVPQPPRKDGFPDLENQFGSAVDVGKN